VPTAIWLRGAAAVSRLTSGSRTRQLGAVALETRVLVVLWHFADRWGSVRSDGVALHLNITHAWLAAIVAAERPAVTLALGRLRQQGVVERGEDRLWLLRGGPPEELGHVREQAVGSQANNPPAAA